MRPSNQDRECSMVLAVGFKNYVKEVKKKQSLFVYHSKIYLSNL